MKQGVLAEPLSILLIEDSKGSAILIQKELEKTFANAYSLVHASTLEEALRCIVEKKFNIALLDRALPDAQEFSGLHSIQNMAPDLPIIYLTGYADEQVAHESIRQGAQDYVFKDNLDGLFLKKAIDFAILRKEYEKVLILRANFDLLTGLTNRRMYENRLDLALAKVERHDTHLAVLFLDLDKFKQINDTFGHAAGDAVLIEVAKRLKSILRPYDTAARFGGDEFAILIEEMPKLEDCEAIAKKIVQLFEAPFFIAKKEMNLSVSIGISYCAAGCSIDREQIIHQADQAMYVAKQNQGSNYFLYRYI
jgi:diguanylate cyclase (GGDEF)-like protein